MEATALALKTEAELSSEITINLYTVAYPIR
jgi:hypothetical protein